MSIGDDQDLLVSFEQSLQETELSTELQQPEGQLPDVAGNGPIIIDNNSVFDDFLNESNPEVFQVAAVTPDTRLDDGTMLRQQPAGGPVRNAAELKREEPEPFKGTVPFVPITEFPEADQTGLPVMTIPIRPELQPTMGAAYQQPTSVSVPLGESWQSTLSEFTPALIKHCIKYNIPIDNQEFFDMAMAIVREHQMVYEGAPVAQGKVADFLFHQLETRSHELFQRTASHAALELNRSPRDPATQEAILKKHFPGGHYELYVREAINLEKTMNVVRMNILTEKVEKLIGREYQAELKAIQDTYHTPKEFQKAATDLIAKIDKELGDKAPDLKAELEYLRKTGVGGIADLSQRALQPHATRSFYTMLERHVVSNDTDINPDKRYGPYAKLFDGESYPSAAMKSIPELSVLGNYADGDLGRIWAIDNMVLKQLGEEVDAFEKIQHERYRIEEQLKADGDITGLALTATTDGSGPTAKTEGFMTVSEVTRRAFGLDTTDQVTEAHLDILLKSNPHLAQEVRAEKRALKGYVSSRKLGHYTTISLEGTTVGRELNLINKKEHLQTLLSSRPLEDRLPENQHRWRREPIPPTLNPQAAIALKAEIETTKEQLAIAEFEVLSSQCISHLEERKKELLTHDLTKDTSISFYDSKNALSKMRTIAYKAERQLEQVYGKPPTFSSQRELLEYRAKAEVLTQLTDRIKGLDTHIHNAELSVANTLLKRVSTLPGDSKQDQQDRHALRLRLISGVEQNAKWLLKNADLNPKQRVSLAQFSASLVVQKGQMKLASFESVKERQKYTASFVKEAQAILVAAQNHPQISDSNYRYDITESLRNLKKQEQTLQSSVLAGSREHAEERFALLEEQVSKRFKVDLLPGVGPKEIGYPGNVARFTKELALLPPKDRARKLEMLYQGLETLASAALDADKADEALTYIRALERFSTQEGPVAKARAATLRVQYKLQEEEEIGDDLAAPLAQVEKVYEQLQGKIVEKQEEVEAAKSDQEKQELQTDLEKLTAKRDEAALAIRKIQAVRIQVHSHLAMAGDRDDNATHLAILAGIQATAEAADRQAIKEYSEQLKTVDQRIEVLKVTSERLNGDPERKQQIDSIYDKQRSLRIQRETVLRLRERYPDARDTKTLLSKVSEELTFLENRRRFVTDKSSQQSLDDRISALKDLHTTLSEDTSGKDALYLINREHRNLDVQLDTLSDQRYGPYRELKELQQERSELQARIRGHHRSIARLYLQGAAVSVKGGDAVAAERLIQKLKKEYGAAGTMMVFKDMQKAVDGFYAENDKGEWVAGLRTMLHEIHGDSLLIEAGVPLAAAGTGAAIGACIGGPPGAGLGFLIGGAIGLFGVKARNLYMGWGRVQAAFDTGLTPLTAKDTVFDVVFTALDVVQIVAPIKGVGALGKAGSKPFVSAAAMSLRKTMPQLTVQEASRLVRRRLVSEAVKDIAGFGGKAVMTVGLSTLVASVTDGFISIYGSDMSPLDKKIALNKMLKQLSKTGTLMLLNMGGESLAVRGATYSSLERTKQIRDVFNGKSRADIAKIEAHMTQTLGKIITELSGDPKLVADILAQPNITLPRHETGRVHVNGADGDIRVSGNGRAVYVNDPKLIREMFIDARRTEIAEQSKGTRTPAEIDLEARKSTGEVFGYYDRSRDQMVVLDTGNRSRDAQIIRNSRIHHEYKHRQGATEAEAWKAQSDFLNRNGFEMEFKDGLITYRKVPEGQKPTAVTLNQIQNHLKKVYGDIDPNAKVNPSMEKLTGIDELSGKIADEDFDMAVRLEEFSKKAYFDVHQIDYQKFGTGKKDAELLNQRLTEIQSHKEKLKENLNGLHDAAGGDTKLFAELVEQAMGPESAGRSPQEVLRAMEDLEAIVQKGKKLEQDGKINSWKDFYDEVTAKLDVNDVTSWKTTYGAAYKAAMKAPPPVSNSAIENSVKSSLRQTMEDIAASHSGHETEIRHLINSLYRNQNFKDAMNATGVDAKQIMTFIADMHMDTKGRPVLDAFINKHGNKSFLSELVQDPQAFRSHVINGGTKWGDIEGKIPSEVQTLIKDSTGTFFRPSSGTVDGNGYIPAKGYRHLVKDFPAVEGEVPVTYRVRWHSKTPNKSVKDGYASVVIERRVIDPADPTNPTEVKYFIPGDGSSPSKWISSTEWERATKIDSHDGRLYLEGFPKGPVREAERARQRGIADRGHINADPNDSKLPGLK